MMYEELNGIDHVFFQDNSTNMIRWCNMFNKDKLDGHGNPWFEGAYGNCLIALKYQKITDKLYLLSHENFLLMCNTGIFGELNPKKVTEILEKYANKTIERN